ncbi:MAG: glycosyl hydrolase [Fimbriimonas sp.]
MLTLLFASCLLSQTPPAQDPLAAAFRNPPASARPHTWWHWMDGNVTREGITADLEAMKQAGIGGAHVFDVGQGIPAGRVEYNTPEWRELFAHAMTEAKRLGLEMTVHNCAGWSSSGGPWVEPKDAMKKVVWSTTEFERSAPGSLDRPLPEPQKVRGYYQDIRTYAFPTPAKTTAPHPLSELTGLGANPGPVKTLNWPRIRRVDLVQIPKERIRPNGTLDRQFPAGKWTVLRMGYTLTGSQNVASRDSGRGLEVDKLDPDSVNAFFDGGPKKYLDRVAGLGALTTVLIDSYETGYNNWSRNGLGFQTRFGYDLEPFLPTLAGFAIDDDATTLGFLFDFRRNLAERWATSYSALFAERLKGYNLQLAIEPYGNGNFDPFSYARPAGLIMGEYWVGEGQINGSVKHAASVAHVYGHDLVGAEALTATPDQAGWRNQPRQWKPFADRAMTMGINRIIYHRFAHQPWVSGVLPGMTMGPWGSHVDRTQTFWSYMPVWDEYLSRCQYLLQSGTFVGDVLLFSGEDSPQSYAGEGQDLPQVPPGYDFDYCGIDPLMSVTVKDHRLVVPGGGSYAVLALPNTTVMTLPLAKKIKQLVEAGAYVLGPKPVRSPSFSEANSRPASELRMVVDEVWGPTSASPGSHARGRGRVYWAQSLKTVLSNIDLDPDFVTGAKDVRAIHRRIGQDDAYFVASAQAYPRTVTARFRIDKNKPLPRVQLWYPATGKIEDAPVWKPYRRVISKGHGRFDGIELPLHFDADGSVFVMLRPGEALDDALTGIEAKIAAVGGKPKPALRIVKAEYGDFPSGKVKDVTKIVQGAAGPHSVRITASNNDMGGDPANMIVKTLRVTYVQGDVTQTVTVRENDTLQIGDLPDAGSPPTYEVHSNPGQLWVWREGDYKLNWFRKAPMKLSVRDLPKPVAVSGPWQVRFPAGWEAPPNITLDRLASWTENTDFGIKHFSGTATYTKTLDVPASLLGTGKRLMLDLGDVRELCRVRLNGKPIATLWKPPFRIDIANTAHAGKNALEVEVTNMWVNRLIGDEQFPDDMGWKGAQLEKWPDWFVNHQPRPEPRRKTFTTWRHNTKETPLLPSGLLGPVLLRPVKVISLRP